MEYLQKTIDENFKNNTEKNFKMFFEIIPPHATRIEVALQFRNVL